MCPDRFAESRGLPVYHHVLHPRLGAFGALSNGMRGHLDALYDVTMAYVDYTPGERPCELAVLKGGPRGATAVHSVPLSIYVI